MSGNMRIAQPSEKQWLFLRDRHKYIAFGGARGGGKSWAVRVKALLLCLRYPGIVVMIIRRTYPELVANHIRPMRGMLAGCGKYNDARKEILFTGGSMILFRYCARESDMDRYQGTEADVIFIDEATQFDEAVYKMFAACLRGVNDFPKRIYFTCNPGGKGHGWVKRLFVDRLFKPEESPEEYSFIQSRVQDNKALMKAQPDYVKQLEALPPKLRKAWLEGDWNVFEGQFFEEFTVNPNEARVGTHVIPAFMPPTSWKRYRSFDFGYAKPFSVGWWAVDHGGVLYRIHELYGCTETENEGVKWEPTRIFEEVRRIERDHPYLRGQLIHGVADPSIWDASRGVSIADMAARQGVYFEPGDNKRLPGWMQMHYRFRFDENGLPMLYAFDTCKAFIRTIPLLCYDEHSPEDVDTDGEDHVADEVRYMCMRNPINPRAEAAPKAKEYDPLDIAEIDARDDTLFYKL